MEHPAPEAELNELLRELRGAGQTADRALLDRIKVFGSEAVPRLIAMAGDEELNQAASDSSEVWAPLHAIQLLGELGAPEAVEPLLPLVDEIEDDYLASVLPEAFGGIGAPAIAPLRAILFDHHHSVWARIRAAEGLSKIGQHHPETRAEVIPILTGALAPEHSREPDDEILNGFIIGELVDLKATEAGPVVRRVVDEDRVDTTITDLDAALELLGVPREQPVRPKHATGLDLPLRCTACGYEREHHVETVYYDLGAERREKKGKKSAYDPFVIPQRITCPKCGAVDRYAVGSMGMIALMAEMLKLRVAHEQGKTISEGPLRFIDFVLTDGREMHPYDARDMYQAKVAANPNNAELRVRYGNVLRGLNYRKEAVEQYRAALRLEPANLEAYLNLGQVAEEAGDRAEAIRFFEELIAQSPHSRLPRRERDEYVESAGAVITRLTGAPFRVAPAQVVAPPASLASVPPKIGRNEPCPCGSGKKYKKCHGR